MIIIDMLHVTYSYFDKNKFIKRRNKKWQNLNTRNTYYPT